MVQARDVALIPGTPGQPPLPLVRYQLSHLTGVSGVFAESATEPGDIVLVIGASTGVPVAEVARVGRRVLAVYRNPIELLRAQVGLAPCPVEQAQAALTQLGDLPKSGRPLISHLTNQYASRCPHCGAPGVAEWFSWDRDAAKPYAKRVRCRRCSDTHEGPVDDEDLMTAGTYPSHEGPSYHLALSRAAAVEGSTPERIAELVQLYTARNLAGLMDILHRLPQLRLPTEVRRVMIALILETLDRCSSLVVAGAPEERPRSLRPPQRFLERNVWQMLERALATYAESFAATEASPGVALPPPTDSLMTFVNSAEAGYHLLGESVHDLAKTAVAGSVSAVLWEVHPPDAAYWAQSVLWASWIWGDNLPVGLRGFLHRRRLDWEWYRRSMIGALQSVRMLVRQGAPLLVIIPAQNSMAVRTIIHAANEAGMGIDRWISCAPRGARILLRFDTRRGDTDTAKQTSMMESAEQILRTRAEPTSQPVLLDMAIALSENAELPDLQVGPSDPIRLASGDLLWLSTDDDVGPPLADRIEDWVLATLTTRERWHRDELIGVLYSAFNGILSPEPELVEACINAYTQIDSEGMVSLRDEDEPEARQAEVRQIAEMVSDLGVRLGYVVARDARGDVTWQESGDTHYLFRCAATAELGAHLLKSAPAARQRCLVIPGGRAALVALKLRRDPRLSKAARDQTWAFIKYRLVRRMMELVHSRADIAVFLGLDPIAEQALTQLALPI